ncbi:hypothetical protein GCM10027174_07410 [Salinifilum aidingensis]
MPNSAPGDSAGWVDLAHQVWLPDAAVLVSAPDGTVVRASEQAAALAGEVATEHLAGRQVSELLVADGAVWRLRGRGPGQSLVRTTNWPHHEDPRLRMTVLLDVSDLASAAEHQSVEQRASEVEAASTAHEDDLALREFQREARIGTWQWDSTGEVLRPSSVLRELTGRTRDTQVSFEDYLASVHPGDRARVRQAWSALAERHHPVEVEHRYVRPDGAVRVFRVRGTATRGADGRVVLSGTSHDITEQREVVPAPGGSTDCDAVTGLPNRTAARDLLQGLLARSGGPDVAVLACRIDNFKRIITSLGHDAGEELLMVLARRLVDGLGPGCTPARITGEDEFVVLCADLAAAGGLAALTDRVSGLVRTPAPIRGQLLQVSASIGTATHDSPEQGVEDLLRFATAAMGEARDQGLGRVQQAGPVLMASVDQQVHVEGQLRTALRDDALQLHYQPIVAIDGTILAAEALVRWPHPDRGLLTPGAFLPVAERGGLVRELDHWVLRAALRAAARWPLPHSRPAGIAVNLSGLVPADPDFDAVVAEAVDAAGLDWARLILELVESELADPRPQTRHGMLGMTRRGARFAIDDFGTGHSSLARFKHLPTDLVKIDRQFVAGLEQDRVDRALTASIIDMTHALGRRCVAEGVETAGQYQVLAELGVEAYQGWLFAPPLPEAEFTALLAHAPLHVPQRQV